MRKLFKLKCYATLFAVGLCLSVYGNLAIGENVAVVPDRARLEQIIVEKLQFYAAEFTDIEFVVLDTDGDIARNMSILVNLLGEDPVPLDYAHPETARQNLLIATLTRIQYLMQENVGSSTLFRAGKGTRVSRPSVCVITVNPVIIAIDDRAATRDLLNMTDDEFSSIPVDQYLDHESHLRYTMDHEIFHCLNSLFNGPVPMSRHVHWGEFMLMRNEQGADAFAGIMHIADKGLITRYIRTLAAIRGLALRNADPGHYTYRAFQCVLEIDPLRLKESTVREKFGIATRIRNDIMADYAAYLRYAAAANQAMLEMGISQVKQNDELEELDAELVSELIEQTQRSYRELFHAEMPVLPRIEAKE